MKKLSLILMLSISSVFVTGCKKETSTVATTSTSNTSNSSDWDSVYTLEESANLRFSDNKTVAVLTSITPFGFKTTLTADGGLSWSSKTSKNVFGIDPSVMMFFDSKNGYATSFNSEVFKTEDGGLNWKKLNFKNYIFSFKTDKSFIVFTTDSVHVIENEGKNQSSYPMDNQNFRTFFGGSDRPSYFYTDDAIYLHSTNNINVLKSVDYGKTWNATTFGASFWEIKVFNTTTWYSVSNNTLYVTKDSGASWNRVDNAYYSGMEITNGIIFTRRGTFKDDVKYMYSVDATSFIDNKLPINVRLGGYFTLKGRVYFNNYSNFRLYRRKF